ncbi:MAG: NAD-glutamate dehydrogenase, partial [Rubrobacteraceae bacterium]
MLIKDELLDKVVGRVREQMSEDQAPLVEEFVRQYYSWISPGDLAGRSPIDIYGAAVSQWTLAQQREPGTTKIRVYNPQFDEHGWQSSHTAAEIVTDDMPFLVDSTRMEVNRKGYAIHLMIHPIMRVRRDDSGRLLEILPPDSEDESAISESVIHVEVDRQTEPEILQTLHENLTRIFKQVRSAVDDWPTMREQVHDILATFDDTNLPVDDENAAEVKAFLEWVADNNFTFLGYREYDLETKNGDESLSPVADSGRGILRTSNSKPVSRSFAKLPPDVR